MKTHDSKLRQYAAQRAAVGSRTECAHRPRITEASTLEVGQQPESSARVAAKALMGDRSTSPWRIVHDLDYRGVAAELVDALARQHGEAATLIRGTLPPGRGFIIFGAKASCCFAFIAFFFFASFFSIIS